MPSLELSLVGDALLFSLCTTLMEGVMGWCEERHQVGPNSRYDVQIAAELRGNIGVLMPLSFFEEHGDEGFKEFSVLLSRFMMAILLVLLSCKPLKRQLASIALDFHDLLAGCSSRSETVQGLPKQRYDRSLLNRRTRLDAR